MQGEKLVRVHQARDADTYSKSVALLLSLREAPGEQVLNAAVDVCLAASEHSDDGVASGMKPAAQTTEKAPAMVGPRYFVDPGVLRVSTAAAYRVPTPWTLPCPTGAENGAVVKTDAPAAGEGHHALCV
jgi:hypothetical protein